MIKYIYISAKSIVADETPATEVYMPSVDSGVDDVDINTIAVTDWFIDVIEWEIELVNAIETPGFDWAGEDYTILLDVLYSTGLTELFVWSEPCNK